jgi:hypothetical protein
MWDASTLLEGGKKQINVNSFAEYKLKDLVDDPELLDQYQPKEMFRIADDRFAADLYDQPAPPLSSEQAKLIEEYGEPRYKADFFDNESNKRVYGSRQSGPLGDIRVVFDPNLEAGEGYWNNDFNTIGIGNDSTPEDVRATLLHELQHAIQAREGFGAGMSADYIEQLQTAAAEFDIRGGQAEIDRLTKLADEYTQAYASGDIKNATLEQASAAVDAQEMIGRRALDERMREIGSKIDPEADGYGSPFAIYKNTAGEVEARNVEQRDRLRRLNSGEASLGEVFPNRPPAPYTAKFDPDQTPAFASERFVGGKDQSRQLFTRGDLFEETVGPDLDPNDFLSGTQLSKRYVDNIRDALKGPKKANIPEIPSNPAQREVDLILAQGQAGRDAFRFAFRGFEDAFKMVTKGLTGVVSPESARNIPETASIAGEYEGDYSALTAVTSKVLGDYLIPLAKGIINHKGVLTDRTLVDDFKSASDAYYELPEAIRDEVGDRIGYGALAAFGAAQFWLGGKGSSAAKGVKDIAIESTPQGLLQAN